MDKQKDEHFWECFGTRSEHLMAASRHLFEGQEVRKMMPWCLDQAWSLQQREM